MEGFKSVLENIQRDLAELKKGSASGAPQGVGEGTMNDPASAAVVDPASASISGSPAIDDDALSLAFTKLACNMRHDFVWGAIRPADSKLDSASANGGRAIVLLKSVTKTSRLIMK